MNAPRSDGNSRFLQHCGGGSIRRAGVGDGTPGMAVATRRPEASRTLRLHLVFGCTSGLLVITTAWLYWRKRGVSRPSPSYLLTLEAITALLLVSTAHLGGILSGVNLPAG